MFEHINTKLCRKLAIREIRFHKVRSVLTILMAVLVTGIFSFVLFLVSTEGAGYEYQIRGMSNTQADILFTGLTKQQAERLSELKDVKEAPWYQSVGTVSEGGASYQLASYSKGYAPTVEAVPTRGRLPEKSDEIAMEVQAAYALGGSSRVGDSITLSFVPEQGEEPVKQEFTLVGTWDSNMYSYLMWVSDELADQFPQPANTASITAGVNLWRTWHIEEKAEKLAREIGVTDPQQYTVNSVFQEENAERITSHTASILKNCPIVFLCGFLMFFSIFQMMLELDIQFYGRMKTIGMTPLQMRCVVYHWVGILVLFSVPLGWLLGYGLTQWVSATFVLTGNDLPGMSLVLPWYDFVLSLLGTWVTVFLAAFWPALKASHMTPLLALHYTGHPTRHPKRDKEISGHTYHPNSLFLIAWKGVARQKGRMAFALAALLVSAVFAGVVAVQYISRDLEKFVSNKFSFDYLVKGDGQKYNVFYDPDDHSLTPELYERLSKAVGNQNISRVYYAETKIKLTDFLWKEIVDYYERNMEYYQDYLQYVGFEEAFRELKEDHTISAAVYGVEEEYMRVMTNEMFDLAGHYDQEIFEHAPFAYVSGMNKNTMNQADDYDQPLPKEGSVLSVDEADYTVMGTARRPYNSMFVKPDAAFYLECYISMANFQKQYPGRSPVELLISAPNGREKEVARIVDSYQEEKGYNYFTIDRQLYYDGGRMSVWTMLGPKIILSAILFLIAILGFINLILHRTLARSKEFAVYRSLGMSRGELLKLLILENVLFTVMAGVLVYGISAIAAGPLVQYLNRSEPDVWFTYHFTLAPAHVLMAVLIILAVMLPIFSVHVTEQESITRRLNMDA